MVEYCTISLPYTCFLPFPKVELGWAMVLALASFGLWQYALPQICVTAIDGPTSLTG